MKVSVVIPAYQAEKIITRTINALLKQDHRPDEIIIVDDGSTDNTAQKIQEFSEVIYIEQENCGPATARNEGAQRAIGDVVFFTDADCIPNTNWISSILPHFDNDEIGVVCGSYDIANPEKILARCIHQEILFRHDKLMPDYPKVFGSYNFAIRRSLFLDVDGFSTHYSEASGEDNDLSYKILKTGRKIYFARQAKVAHFHTASLFKYLREQARHGFWRARLYQRHPEMMRGDGYTFLKDMTEVPVSLVIGVLFFPCLFWLQNTSIPYLGMVLFFALFELFYAMRICHTFVERMYFTVVMFLRAFVRSFAFIIGAALFSLIPKKT